MAVIMYFKELFWITNGICKTVWKKPYRQYDVLIAKVLSIDICKKKNHLCDHYLSPLSSNYCVILPV